jgi:TPR repeat protein
MRTILITLALLASFSTYAYSTEDCDILASLEADPSSVATPVAFDDINSSAVIYACSKAILRNDEHKPRFLLHRARGYLKGGESDKALFDLEQSHNLGYPAATFGLATAYFLGDDVAQDLDKARQLFIDSFEHGVSWSAQGLSMLYGNEMYDDYDLEKAKKWEARFKDGY